MPRCYFWRAGESPCGSQRKGEMRRMRYTMIVYGNPEVCSELDSGVSVRAWEYRPQGY